MQHDGRAARALELELEQGCIAVESAGVMRRFVAGIAATAGLLLLPACASRNSYVGISLAAGQANSEPQQPANADKQAQLELGIAFEKGRGVPVNVGRALKMYVAAATLTGGDEHVAVPSCGYMRPVKINSGFSLSDRPEARRDFSGLSNRKPLNLRNTTVRRQKMIRAFSVE